MIEPVPFVSIVIRSVIANVVSDGLDCNHRQSWTCTFAFSGDLPVIILAACSSGIPTLNAFYSGLVASI